MTYQPIVKQMAFPQYGPTNSRDLNNFIDQVVKDIHGLNSTTISNEIRIEETFRILVDEILHLKQKVSQLEKINESFDKINARNGLRVSTFISMYDLRNIKYFQNQTLRPVVDSTYGIMHLPVNAVESKFYTSSIFTTDTISPLSLTYSVSSTFTDSGAVSAVDHEEGAIEIDEGIVPNAFNGVNTKYWVRTVEFSAESDVTEVQCELIVNVPNQNNTMSNVLTIHPYPIGNVDIIDISVSSDLSGSFVSLPHPDAPTASKPLNNAREHKFVFSPMDIDQVRIRLRQKNFTNYNGRKVFRYGMQELGLFLIDFEKSTASLTYENWSAQNDADNIVAVWRLDAPAGNFFTAINHFSTEPDFTLEQAANRHFLFKIYDGDPTTGSGVEIWNSNMTLPQNQPSNIGAQISLAGNIKTLYVSASLRYVQSSGGVSSPFRVNTSPYLKGISIEYSLATAF
jgi:hypothetical protein